MLGVNECIHGWSSAHYLTLLNDFTKTVNKYLKEYLRRCRTQDRQLAISIELKPHARCILYFRAGSRCGKEMRLEPKYEKIR